MGTQVISLIIGIILGASLVLADFSEPDKIIKALRLKDIHIIRTIIVILIVAIIGTWLVKLFSTVEIDNKPATILTLVIGGLLFGAGAGLTGYTPGTSFAGAASGKIDAIFAITGMFFGGYVYVFLYPPAIKPLEIIYNYGKVTLPEITHIPAIVWIILFSAAGTIVLFLTWIQKFLIKPPNIKNEQPIIKEYVFEDQIPGLLSKEENFPIKTDSFDTTQILRVWKNIFFCLIIICLLSLQIFFWIINHGKEENSAQLLFGITFEQVITISNIFNTLLIFSAILYVFTIFSCLSISFGANLGGLRYISRAFFSAIVALILLLPWQIPFGRTLFGVIYTPSELIDSNYNNTSQIFSATLIYLRFVGYWAFVMFLLIRSQVYSHKWTKTLLERIEQII
ncbi:MAG: YeeE/YedE family protein [Sedimentisphaerales bacterium]|nr:YeeE/YedE family protein [Sedimentisphaerales bacterium]